jgi:hypothetical protein
LEKNSAATTEDTGDHPTPQSKFLMVMNLIMQGGTPRLEAEEEAIKIVREMGDSDFTLLRA